MSRSAGIAARFRRQGFWLVVLLALLPSASGCDSQQNQNPSAETSDNVELAPRQMVLVSLPLSNGLSLLDPDSGHSRFLPLDQTVVNTPSASLVGRDSLLVTGSGGSGLTEIPINELDFGPKPLVGLGTSSGKVSMGFSSWFMHESPHGIFLVGDGISRGALLRFDSDLNVAQRVNIPYSQTGAIGSRSQLWVTAEAAPGGRTGGSLSLIQLADVSVKTRRLGDYPAGIALDPSGRSYVVVRDARQVKKFSPALRQLGEDRLPGEPWGIASHEWASVISLRNGNKGMLALFDLRRMQIMTVLDLPTECSQPFDLAMDAQIAVVMCSQSANVAIVDLDTRKIQMVELSVPLTPEFQNKEQPRNPLITTNRSLARALARMN